MDGQTVTARIFRYDPSRDPAPRYETYQVPRAEGMVVGDVLTYIYENYDGSLGYRWECRSRQCGSCTMMMNGRPILSCKEAVPDELTLEPLPKLPLVRDLVVEIGPIANKMRPWRDYEKEPAKPVLRTQVKREDLPKYRKTESCIECMACDSVCPVTQVSGVQFDSWGGPRSFARLHRLVLNPQFENDFVKIGMKHGLYSCVMCLACVQTCPKEVDPADRIVDLMNLAHDRGLGGSGERHIKAVIDAVGAYGKPNEFTMPMSTKGFEGLPEMVGMIPVAVKMVTRGKKLPPTPKPIENMEEVKRIYEILEGKK